MKFDFNLATFVVGILSLIGVITNVVVTTINNRKKRYTDLITQRRLQTFQRIIDCSTNCIKSVYGVTSGVSDDSLMLSTFVENKLQIFYNTNYKAAAEKELREALTLLHNLLESYVKNKDTLTSEQKDQIFDTLKAGAEYYQVISAVYCKCEWVRIKETTLSVKETMDTQKEYFDRVEDMKSNIENNKKALYTNTFENIVKK